MPYKPKERIIPIQIESDDSPPQSNNRKVSAVEEPSTSKEPIMPVQMETESPVESDDMGISIKSALNNSDDKVDKTLQNVPLKRSLPMCNVTEKIAIILDTAEDDHSTPFKFINGQQHKPLDMLKFAVEMFLRNKHRTNKKHEFALGVLNENDVVWLVDFTSNINQLINALKEIKSCETEDIFELNSLFDVFLEKLQVPVLSEVEGVIMPPPYIVRTILFYGRSYTMPNLLETEKVEHLLNAPYFTLDVLMTHEPVDDNNNCNKIFNVLQNLDKKGGAYFFAVGRNAKNLFSSVGKLLGHSLQRAILQQANYAI